MENNIKHEKEVKDPFAKDLFFPIISIVTKT